MKIVIAIILSLAMVVELRKQRPRPNDDTTSAQSTETTSAPVTTAASSQTTEDDEVMSLVKSYIDAGTCGTVSTGSSCGDSAVSYYAEFDANGNQFNSCYSLTSGSTESDVVMAA